jgi:hypothetical protein
VVAEAVKDAIAAWALKVAVSNGHAEPPLQHNHVEGGVIVELGCLTWGSIQPESSTAGGYKFQMGPASDVGLVGRRKPGSDSMVDCFGKLLLGQGPGNFRSKAMAIVDARIETVQGKALRCRG